MTIKEYNINSTQGFANARIIIDGQTIAGSGLFLSQCSCTDSTHNALYGNTEIGELSFTIEDSDLDLPVKMLVNNKMTERLNEVYGEGNWSVVS